MSLKMQYSTLPFGGFTTVDVTASKVDRMVIRFGDSHPAMASWVMWAPQQQTPIPRLAFVVIWDDGAVDETGNGQSATRPLFEGYVEEIKPGENGHTVEYTAYDATRRAANEITIMSTAWDEGTIVSGMTGTRPEPGTGAVPRLVGNVYIDNDPDYAFERFAGATVGGIIAGLLEDQYQPLYWINAAPGDGTAAGNGIAYLLDSNSGTGASSEIGGMTTIPQEKIVFDSEGLRSGIARLMQQYAPNYRMWLRPGERKWRFYDITQSPQVTLTLNDKDASNVVLSMSLEPSIEECHTAVMIYGPETTLVAAPDGSGDVAEFTTSGSAPTLSPLGSGIVLETYTDALGTHDVVAYTRWQIVDSSKRRGAKLLSRTITVPMISPGPNNEYLGYQFVQCKSPCLQISFDGGQTWVTVGHAVFDFQNGIVDMTNPIYFWVDPPPLPPSNQRFFVPTDVRLIWAYYTDPLSVRKPASGYEGTAYTVAGLQSEMRLYDEALAVGYEYGTPVTTSAREAAFETLAQQLLDERKNIVYTGGCTLAGLRYEFCRLNKRINIAGVDGDGNSLSTGWESINAVLTDVEYDFANQLTTLTFSSDQMALMRIDPEAMKEKLKIKALEQVETYSSFVQFREDRSSPYGPALRVLSYAEINRDFVYVDPDTGEVQS